MGGPPIRHHEARKLPISLENVVQQMRVLAGVHAIHQVVGAHDGLHIGVLDADLEGQQVALAHAPFVDLSIGGGAARLLIVQGEVLDAADHVLGLNGVDVRGGDLAGQDGDLRLWFRRCGRRAARGRSS